MESIRTPRGPSHRKIIDLGKLDLPRDDWKTLANRIEDILCVQQTFFTPPIISKAWLTIMPNSFGKRR